MRKDSKTALALVDYLTGGGSIRVCCSRHGAQRQNLSTFLSRYVGDSDAVAAMSFKCRDSIRQDDPASSWDWLEDGPLRQMLMERHIELATARQIASLKVSDGSSAFVALALQDIKAAAAGGDDKLALAALSNLLTSTPMQSWPSVSELVRILSAGVGS